MKKYCLNRLDFPGVVIWRVFLVFIFILSAESAFAQVVLITNKANPVGRLTKLEVERVYRLKKTTWRDGSYIQSVNLPVKNSTREKFSRMIFRISAKRMKQYYLIQALRGKGQPPVVLKSDKEVKEYIRENINALGYIELKNLDDSVKVILVNGKKEIE